MREIIVDSFAGGGGASTGIELATGRSVDVAINHDPAAVAMHRANHPETEHYCESVWDVSPRNIAKGRKVALCWLSPDCKHFSKAKGGKPVEKSIRGLAWVAVRWAATVRPRVIMLENVEEFTTWGPLAIHASRKIDRNACRSQSIAETLNKHGIFSMEDFPTGMIITTCQLVDCLKVITNTRLNEPGKAIIEIHGFVEGNEYRFGDYSEGRFAWELTDVEVLQDPIIAKGQLRLWTYKG